MSENINRSSTLLRNLDWFTVVLYTILVVAGAISIYAASYDYDQASMFDFSEFSGKQFMWISIAFIVGFSILLIDSYIFETYSYLIYGVVLLILILTIFIAPDIKGSRSWIVLGPISLQPAEFAKFATALALARLFGAYNFSLNRSLMNYVLSGIIIFTPFMLILLQHETGSALVFTSLMFVLYREGMSGFVLFAGLSAIIIFVVTAKFAEDMIMAITLGEFCVFIFIMVLLVVLLWVFCRSFFVGRNVAIWFVAGSIITGILSLCGINVHGYIFFGIMIIGAIIYLCYEFLRTSISRYLTTIGFTILAIMFMFSVNFVFNNVLEPHQQMRIKVALGIEEDIRGAGYNVNQSKIAIGSGGLFGKGFLNGTQTKLKYVPEQHTDFIFCTIGEEEGFIGSATVLLLMLALILRIIAIAERQQSDFARIYGYCVASYLIFHLSINIGMVIGLCPVIGIPLPFFSYGGSSLLAFTILLFILLRLDINRRY